jgi:hypothetical protein
MGSQEWAEPPYPPHGVGAGPGVGGPGRLRLPA